MVADNCLYSHVSHVSRAVILPAMKKPKSIQKVFKSKPVTEGAGVRLKRAFGFSQLPLFDPFLLLDDFRSDHPADYLKGFPWHPHRGIETITYLLEGSVEHHDSLGNTGTIFPGEAQWMTAGRGIIHEEMPLGDNKGSVAGFQLWANLPASAKMVSPGYRDITADMIPLVHLQNGVTVRVICGNIDGTPGAVDGIAIDPEYLDVAVPAGTTWNHEVKEGYKVFTYIIAGSGYFSHNSEPLSYEAEGVNYFDMEIGSLMDNETLVLYHSDGDHIHVSTEDSPVRFLLFSGKPLHEPVAWHGPIVMNTRDELQKAFEEYNNGTFLS